MWIKTAFRNLRKQKYYSIINISGLSIGIAFCLLIFLYVKSEMTYDNFHEKKDNIYRVLRVDKNPDGSVRRLRGGLPIPTGPALVREIAAVGSATRFLQISTWVKAEDFISNEPLLFTDPSFFDIFSFKLITASTVNPLKDINSVILTEKEAEKLFGSVDVTGRTVAMKIEDVYSDFIVTGVVENIPENSSIRFDILLNYYVIEHSSRYRDRASDWRSNNSSIFVLLNKNVEKADAGTSVLINEKLKKELEWDSALGKTIPGQQNSVVVGVVNDFHNISLHSEIPAVVLYMDPTENSNFILAKLDKNDISGGLKALEKTWTQYVSNVPFVFNFLDEEIDLQYKSTRKWGSIIKYSSAVALFLAWPAAYIIINKWLQNFAYRININVWLFILSGILTLFVALITIVFQSTKAALANPVESLKYE